jgi:hypothetical protein
LGTPSRMGLLRPPVWHATCNQPMQQRFSTRCEKSETADSETRQYGI